MRQEAIALRQAGYAVSVICPRGENHDRGRFEMYDGIRVYRYPLYWQASSGPKYVLEYSWAMLCTFALMVWICLRYRVDYVHAANPPDLFSVLFRPFGWFGKKFVYDQHDLCPETYESKFHRQDWIYRLLLRLERHSYRVASLVLATNQSFCDVAQARGDVASDKLVIVRSGPDLTHFQPTAALPQLKRGLPYMVAYLGVMSLQDGVDRVISAAHHLQQLRGRPDVLFALVGKGDQWEKLRQQARELGLNGTVEFTGRIPDSELLQYLSTADVCIAPDPPIRLNHMSTMNKILEYMACGKPIVSFDLVESRRSAGAAAVYVDRDDPKLLAEEIDALLKDPNRRRKIGECGRERVTSELSWDHSARKLVDAYARLRNTEQSRAAAT